MIALMRKLIHNNLYKVFLWMFLFMMAAGSGLVFFRQDPANWAIKVYRQTVSAQKYAAILKQVQQQQAMYSQRGIKVTKADTQKEALESAVSKALMQHVANSLGFAVSDKLVNNEIIKQTQGWPSYFFKENGELNYDVFLKAIAPLTIDEVLEDVATSIQGSILQGLNDIEVYVPQFEQQMQYDADFADKEYSYVRIPLQKFMHQVRQDKPSTEDLKRFYKKPEIVEQFKTVERRSGTVWTFSPSVYVSSVSDADIKNFYEKNKNSRYVVHPAQMQVRQLLVAIEPGKEQEAKAKIQEIKEQADKNPAKFEELVKKLSDDKAEAVKGGLTPLFTKNDTKLSKVVVDTAFEFLGKDGDISSPIKTDRGYELIQRVKRVPAQYKDLASVSAEIRQELGAEKFKKRFAQDAARVVQAARYQPEVLKGFVERYKGVKSEISMGVRQSTTLSAQLFKMEEGRYTQFFDQDKGVILLCDTIEKSTTPALSDVESKVLDLYYETRAKALLSEQVNQMVQQAATMSFEDLAKKYDITVQKAQFSFKNGKPDQSPVLKEEALRGKIKNLTYQGAVVGAESRSEGIVMRLDHIASVSPEVVQEQGQHLQQAMMYKKMYLYKEGFIASLYRIAKLNNKIDIKKELLQKN